ncbi:CDP-alcohol phosphatidyltransferase family protein [Chelativorans sp. ZYF759]|uniref:CDP-alcohol phosphatidyltransferase family protein n=1 Tax=Chelativorans sp. ZYF759 TaxID=2692213 RepID=UPI00145F978F|nr:CDP-alcohol phosphatidyltransferase family protein [Chelativorans sp. ZYF759]NMG41739.1 CDP-alcohol phosphatidyltransferase family protein [Chelativorans sp. ZYF759]
MLDGWAKSRIDPLMEHSAERLAGIGITANQVTVASWVLGLAAAAAIAFEWYVLGLALFLLNRLGDGLDGAIARLKGSTELGGYLDIVLDFAIYGAVPLGFILAEPGANALAGAVLLVSFYVNGASFLAFSAIAARLGMETRVRGPKSIYFTTGLAEGTETILFFVLFCLFPGSFAPLALVFAAMCFWTAFWRILEARRLFG